MTTEARRLFLEMLLSKIACQYYVTARSSMHAQCMLVCGNLFHHTVEMLLKGGLVRKRKLSELKDKGHNLKKLWRAFKTDFPDLNMKRHDKTIRVFINSRPSATRTGS